MMGAVAIGLALLAAGPGTAPPLDADADIVVVGQRIAQVAILLGRDADGRTTCGLSRSSGDVRIDSAVCKRAAKCVGRGPADAVAVDACVERQKQKLAADWAKGARS